MAVPGEEEAPLSGKKSGHDTSIKKESGLVIGKGNLDQPISNGLAPVKANGKSVTGKLKLLSTLPPDVPCLWNPRSARCQIIILLLGVIFINTMLRNTMSMGIVCMVNSTAMETKNRSIDEPCGNVIDEDAKYEGPLQWNSEQKGIAMSAIYWGGLITAIPLGYLADRHSPKLIIEICLVINTICCFLVPIATIMGDLPGLFALRFIMGFGGQATIYPTACSMFSRWIPPNERSTAMAIFTTGAQLGMIVAGPLNAFLCQQTYPFDGWKGIFYFTGIGMVPIILAWFIFAADTPEKYRWIRKAELEFIQVSLAEQHLRKKRLKWKQVPWKKMCLSIPLNVTFVGTFALSAVATTLQSYIPLYFKQALQLNLKANRFLSALPFLAQLLGKLVSSPIADRLRSSKLISPTWNCKIFNAIGTIGSSIFLMAAAYMTRAQTVQAIALLTISSVLYTFQLSGFLTSLLAMAPAYTGIVNSLSRFYGQIGSVIAPLLVGPMTPEGTATEWRNVFWLMSGLMTSGGVLFLIFGSAEIQNWAKRDTKEGQQIDADDTGESS